VHEFESPEPWYVLATEDDAAALGVYGTPIVILIGSRRVYLGEMGRAPDLIATDTLCA
jgi:hypothetical protein